MSKRRSQSSYKPSYRDALSSMRHEAHTGVLEAMQSAQRYRTPSRRKSHAGEEAYALYDGVTAALAQSIISQTAYGSEAAVASAVADLLMTKVQSLLCAGSC